VEQSTTTEVLSIPSMDSTIEVVGLPPSKSHLIRWLLMAAQSESNVRLKGVRKASDDACAMRDALMQLGVQIDVEDDEWTVHGVGHLGFSNPNAPLNLHNSGTALRILSVAILQIGQPVWIDGDVTLNPRIDRQFWQSLDVDVEFASDHQNLPMKLTGPLSIDSLELNVGKTSQHLSALLLSMPARKDDIILTIEGGLVSQRHAKLSYDIASKCGSPNKIDDHRLRTWKCEPPTVVQIPLDASHVAFWKLYEIVHDCSLKMPNVSSDDSIGAEVLLDLDLREFNTVDLRDANDLITPLAAAMAIGGGGQIIGASHARHKESNRIENTASMLSEFSIDVECTDDGLKIPGGQHPNSPDGIVETMGDHRMQMAAVILATKVGAEIRGSRLHEVSFPEFLDYIQP
jgi:3-phosphoshikimate 1-carboxyvinyltransferase